MSNFQANLRALFTENAEMKKLLERLNTSVMNSAKGEKFITLFIAKYNFRTRELCYVNAGHNPPLLYEISSGKMSQLGSGCVGMGMLDELPFVNEHTLILNEPAKLFCYTDGLVEVLHESGIEFGTEDLEKELSNDGKLDDNIDTIIENQKILEGSTSIFDDISILGLQFPGRNGF
jgi:sigma-B regulation protein RsbU (phosphoserine phosphatase)